MLLNPTSRTGAAAAALAAVVLTSGCSLLTGTAAGSDSSPAPASSTAPQEASSTPTADVGRVVMDHDYGSQRTGGSLAQDLTVTLTGVHRIDDEVGLVSARIDTNKVAIANTLFNEPQDGDASAAFSAVTVAADGDPTLYQSVRDTQGRCLCSTVPNLTGGASVGVWAYVSLPKGATTVTVTVNGLQPWVGVPVS